MPVPHQCVWPPYVKLLENVELFQFFFLSDYIDEDLNLAIHFIDLFAFFLLLFRTNQSQLTQSFGGTVRRDPRTFTGPPIKLISL